MTLRRSRVRQNAGGQAAGMTSDVAAFARTRVDRSPGLTSSRSRVRQNAGGQAAGMTS